MMTSKECASAWRTVVERYKTTYQDGPDKTMEKVIKELGIEKTQEVLATVTKIKMYDGRIYPENKKAMNEVSVNQDNCKWEHGNAMIYASIDDIHPSHLNQMITSMRSIIK